MGYSSEVVVVKVSTHCVISTNNRVILVGPFKMHILLLTKTSLLLLIILGLVVPCL